MARRTFFAPWILGFSVAWGAPASRTYAEGPDAGSGATEFFEKAVRPVLVERCQTCHGGAKQKGGLRLDSRAAILRGGETGPSVVPGKPAESLLIGAVNYADDLQMPPKSRLSAVEVAALTRWVEMGLPWPADSHANAPAAGAAAGFDLQARRAAHWAWRAIEPKAPPAVKATAWPGDAIDRFLLARLEEKGLTPAPDADRRVLIRRLTFDLTGLPPTPGEVAAFQNDPRPGAEARVVDRLLASPRFGERWGRHWLDLVRYAESRGHEFDATIPNAWHYRDYVVRALNADLPYDRFVTEQVAGDLLDRPRIDPSSGANESLVGTGFWFLGEEVHSPVDIRQDEADRMDNRLDVMTKAFLGLTVACARCHDHKFDAISQRDYYAMSGFLVSSGYRQARYATLERERLAAVTLQADRDAARKRVLFLAARSARVGIDALADHLSAARLRQAGGEVHGVDPDRVEVWANELARARADLTHPLHGLAAATGDPVGHAAGAATPAENRNAPERVIVDFGTVKDLTRLQDGFAFGLRPARPGDLAVSGEAGHPQLALTRTASARRDPAFRTLTLSPRTERDHGRLGVWDRSGQTLRTPGFTVGSGNLWYLVRGPGRAYAAVNGHLLVAGPLHGKVFTEWNQGEKTWRWMPHDLTDYKGHRTHIEFSPVGVGDLEIARVVESEGEPRQADVPDGVLALALSAPGADTPGGLARAYQSLLTEAARRMEADALVGPATADDLVFARLADWVVRSPELFNPATGPETRAALDSEAGGLLEAERSLARRLAPATNTTPAMADGTGVNEHLFIRGSSRAPGPEVPRRFLEAIAGTSPLIEPSATEAGSGRLALAGQMVGPSNPFASRVVVNRVWYHLFGRGIVASVDNFGVLGEPPTHPELLDHLADRFVRSGWSLKHLIRTMVLTRAYRMSSRPDPRADALDPGNHLLHRMPVRRLEAEPIRDAILFVSGRLVDQAYGPSIPVHLTPFMEGRGRPAVSGPVDGDGRRSLYLALRRNFLTPMMLAFDAPIPFTSVGRRNVSNVPAQALILMNDPFVTQQAALWADRVLTRRDDTPPGRVSAMYRSAFARPAEPAELTEALEFLDSQGREYGLTGDAWKDDRRVWADLAHVLFNSKEFLFID